MADRTAGMKSGSLTRGAAHIDMTVSETGEQYRLAIYWNQHLVSVSSGTGHEVEPTKERMNGHLDRFLRLEWFPTEKSEEEVKDV